jgi:hypothetical protein
MKPGVYQVRGNDHGEHTKPVAVTVEPVGDRIACGFDFDGIAWAFEPRPMSPAPMRLLPTRCPIGIQATARSIASAAFKAAQKAADDDKIEAEKDTRQDEIDRIGLDTFIQHRIASGAKIGAEGEPT